MNSKIINPYQAYTAEEAAELLSVDKRTLYKEFESGTIQAKELGKGWKVLGENLLTFMGSPTVLTQQMSKFTTPAGLSAATPEETINAKQNTNETVGAAVVK